MTALLEVESLVVAFDGAPVINGLSFTVPAASVTALLGANGAGKTTTLRAISGLVRASGSIRLDGESIAGQPPEAIARRGVAHVPEGRGTFLHLSVDENLRLGAWLRRDRHRVEADRERLFNHFPRLKERLSQQAGTLSGGEQQMLAIARALLLEPRLLLLDEPSFGLSPKIVLELFDVLRRIRDQDRVAMLIVEQNVGVALDIADHAHLLELGRMVRSGDAASVRDDAAVRRAYLGQ